MCANNRDILAYVVKCVFFKIFPYYFFFFCFSYYTFVAHYA